MGLTQNKATDPLLVAMKEVTPSVTMVSLMCLYPFLDNNERHRGINYIRL